jgi:hypothetical protein
MSYEQNEGTRRMTRAKSFEGSQPVIVSSQLLAHSSQLIAHSSQ